MALLQRRPFCTLVDLPSSAFALQAQAEAASQLKALALSSGDTCGKWLLFRDGSRVDAFVLRSFPLLQSDLTRLNVSSFLLLSQNLRRSRKVSSRWTSQ